MPELVTDLANWLSLNPQWIALVIGLTAFVESLAMIGVIIPGVTVLYAASALAGGLDLPILPAVIAALIGAVAGDLLSFFLGRHAHGFMLGHWPFRQHPRWIERGERFIQRYGMPSVVIGRFVGPIRPVLPFVAGMLQMPPTRFIAINLFSALLWAPAFVLPGYLLGRASQIELTAPAHDPLLNLLLLALIVMSLVLIYGVHRRLDPSRSDNAAATYHASWQRFRSPRSGELPLGSALLAACCLVGFGLLALTVTLTDSFEPINHAVYQLLQQLRTPDFDRWVIGFTLIGDGASVAGLGLIAIAGLWLRGDKTGALHWLTAMGVLVLINHLVKFGLAIPRPQMLEAYPLSFSFPSAHTSNSALLFAGLASFIAQHQPYQRRWRSYAIAALPMIAMGLSRLYLGVHWVSDVLGGTLLALAVLGVMRVSYSRGDRPHWQQPPLWPLLLAAALWSGGYVLLNFSAGLNEYG